MATPTKPAIRPMYSVSGVPTIMTDSRSRPWVSVPSGYWADGGADALTDSGL